MDPNLSIESAQAKAKMAERVKKQQVVVRGEPGMLVQSVSQNKYQPKAGTNFKNRDEGNQAHKGNISYKQGEKWDRARSSKREDVSKQENRCEKCGYTPRHHYSRCPARDSTCFKCQKRGHFKTQCREKSVNMVEGTGENSEEEEFFMGSIDHLESRRSGYKPWVVNLQVAGTQIPFKIDTGADVSLVGRKTFMEIKNVILKSTKQRLFGPGKAPIQVEGKFNASLEWNNKQIVEEIFVTKENCEPLLGRPAIESLGLIKIIAQIESKANMGGLVDKYQQLFTGLGQTKKPYHIELIEDAKPYTILAPRRIAIPIRERVKAELDRMVKEGIIEPVDEPTDWCAGMVPILKKDGNVRICVDLQELNKNIKRERFVMPKVDQSLALIGHRARVFSKIDANCGFWQVPLTPESAKCTTFITPFGRFYFKKLPFGITSAPEHFEKRVREIVQGLEGVVSQLDDILIFGNDMSQHNKRLEEVLGRLKGAGFTLNPNKCQFGKSTVKFLGHVVSKDGISADPDRVKAVTDYKRPTNRTELRGFMGMVMQMLKFVPDIAEVTRPLRSLLSTKNEWVWTADQEEALVKTKQMMTSTPTLATYDPNQPTRVTSDASAYGVGAVLEQKQEDGRWRPVAYASRCLSETEQRYAQVEKEALAVTWATEKFSDYLIGISFTVVTDHKPLLVILGAKRLDGITPRLQRLKMKLMMFNFNMEFCPGKSLWTADALSRAPVETGGRQDVLREEQLKAFVNQIEREVPCSEDRLEEIKQEQRRETTHKRVLEYICNGWPKSAASQPETVALYKHRNELTVNEGIIMYNSRLYIPTTLRNQIFDKLHEGHLGVEKCRRRARETIWWPNINNDIVERIARCNRCIEVRNNRQEPFYKGTDEGDPWMQVGGDIFMAKGEYFLVVEDYFSNYPEVCKLESIRTLHIIKNIKSIFARFGIPRIFRADSGTQFDSWEFKEFARSYGFTVVLSSPKFSRSNGLAESGVKMVKKILKTSEDFQLGLLAYRSSPLESGFSPAELLMGRRLRTTVPGINENYSPEWRLLQLARNKKEAIRMRQENNFNSRHRPKQLEPLMPGRKVWITDMKRYGEIKHSVAEPRSYIVRTPGRDLRRNRANIIPCPEISEEEKAEKVNDIAEEEQEGEREMGEVDLTFREVETTNKVADLKHHEVGIRKTWSGRPVKPPSRLDL